LTACVLLSVSQGGAALLPPRFNGKDRGQRFQLEYLSLHHTAVAEEELDLGAVNAELVSLEQKIEAAGRIELRKKTL